MPLIVRLIHGIPPKGLKTSFVPEFRLLGFIEVENNVFALPLQKDLELISIPLNTKLKMQCAKNMTQLENFTEFKRLIDKSMRHLLEVKGRLQVLDLKLYDKDGSNKKECVLIAESKITNYFNLLFLINNFAGLLANGYVLKKSANDTTSTNGVIESKTIVQNQMTASEYDEIDQIYDYVRGLASLPKNLNNYESLTESSPQKLPQHSYTPPHRNSAVITTDMRFTTSSGSSKVNNSHKRENHLFNSDSWIKHELLEKPIPPSIKNLPSKKQLAQKRPTLIFSRSNNNNCNVNNNNLNCSSSHGPKISSPQKDSNELSPQSPLFHIR